MMKPDYSILYSNDLIQHTSIKRKALENTSQHNVSTVKCSIRSNMYIGQFISLKYL